MYEVSKFYQIQFPPAANAVGAEFAVDVYSNSRHAKSTKFEISSRNKSKLEFEFILHFQLANDFMRVLIF